MFVYKRLLVLTLGALFLATLFFSSTSAHAASLQMVSDRITTSQPLMASDHTIQFTVTNPVPAGGRIVLTPQAGAFDLPATLDHTAIDLEMATSGPARDVHLGPVVVGTETSGVAVTTGQSGSITITLSASSSIPALTPVTVKIGSHATGDATSSDQIINPATTTSYRIAIETRDVGNQKIDGASAMVAIVMPVGVTADTQGVLVEAIRFNGLPAGLIPGGTQNVMISLETHVGATCRYATSSGVAYDSMNQNMVVYGASSTIHYRSITGLSDGTTYQFFVRCETTQGVKNPNDYLIQFEVGLVPSSPGAGGVATGPGTRTSPGLPGSFPSGGLFLPQSQVTFDGYAYPNARIRIMQDGALVEDQRANALGRFTITVQNLERGTYTFALSAEDESGRISSTYTSTISILSESGNTVSQIYIPPTIDVGTDTLEAGDTLSAFGTGVPSFDLEVVIQKQGIRPKTIIATTTQVGANGEWSVVLDTTGLDEETYMLRARTLVPNVQDIDFSKTIYIGVGGAPEPDFFLRADLNRDGFVNLIDFSILLFYWGTNDDVADINLDGLVEITDFSIMVFYWTG
jgi:hypothetical protein